MNRTDAVAAPAADSFAAADALLAQRGQSFHWARRLLSARHGERATRLYGFCRRIDDLADEARCPLEARASLAAARRALQIGHSDKAEWADMLELMRTCGIDQTVPLELIRGVESDLGDVRVADMDELLRYCYRVAGTVGLMMTAALDVTAPEALPHAIDLGIAMQLTNICRDVRDDALLGRRYLPASLVGALDPASLVDPTGAVRATACAALRVLLDVADRHYDSGMQGLRWLPPGARAGIRVAAESYREIGVVLRESDCDCWSARARVGTPRKLAITLRALADGVAPQRAGPAHRYAAPSGRALPRPSAAPWSAEARVAD